MRRLIFISCLAILPGSLGAQAVLQEDFSKTPEGKAVAAYFTKTWNAVVQQGIAQGRAAIIKEEANRFLRVAYPAGKIGSRDSGAQWIARFKPAEVATLEYRFRFGAGFDWTTGGKLPGLGGGSSASGGNPDPAGFSSRCMWGKGGGIFLYLYHSRQKGKYGDGMAFDQVKAVPGRWHVLKQTVTLNTPGKPDGSIEFWFDGRKVLERRDLTWRREGDTWAIDQLFFSTFHGGSTDDYRPSRDNAIDFDDFKLTAGRELR